MTGNVRVLYDFVYVSKLCECFLIVIKKLLAAKKREAAIHVSMFDNKSHLNG